MACIWANMRSECCLVFAGLRMSTIYSGHEIIDSVHESPVVVEIADHNQYEMQTATGGSGHSLLQVRAQAVSFNFGCCPQQLQSSSKVLLIHTRAGSVADRHVCFCSLRCVSRWALEWCGNNLLLQADLQTVSVA